jgi:uncharacterized membrane protein
MVKMTKTTMLPIGLVLILLGFTLFIVYLGQSAVVGIVALLLFGTAGVMLMVKSMPDEG